MTKAVSIIVGSVLGATEYVADAVEALLKNNDYSCSLHLQPNLADIATDSLWIVCSSTHGAGDLPDNIQPFIDEISHTDLGNVNALIIGLGDTSYDTYCQGAITIENTLKDAGATIMHTPLHIDVLQHPIPEDIAISWLTSKLGLAKDV